MSKRNRCIYYRRHRRRGVQLHARGAVARLVRQGVLALDLVVLGVLCGYAITDQAGAHKEFVIRPRAGVEGRLRREDELDGLLDAKAYEQFVNDLHA